MNLLVPRVRVTLFGLYIIAETLVLVNILVLALQAIPLGCILSFSI